MFVEILKRLCLVLHWVTFLFMIGLTIAPIAWYLSAYNDAQRATVISINDFPQSNRFGDFPAEVKVGDIVRSGQTGRFGQLMPDRTVEVFQPGELVISPVTGALGEITSNNEIEPIANFPDAGELFVGIGLGISIGILGWILRFILTGSKVIFPWSKP